MTETRAQLEARLKAASDSMTRRLANMEDEVRLPAVSKLGGVVGGKRGRKIALAAGVGLVIGLMFGGGKRAKSEKRRDEESYDSEMPAGKGLVAFALGYAVRQGVNAIVRELVKRAVSRNAPPDHS